MRELQMKHSLEKNSLKTQDRKSNDAAGVGEMPVEEKGWAQMEEARILAEQ